MTKASQTDVQPTLDTSALGFYRDMNSGERATFWGCAAGWAMDGMDYMMYPLVLGTIIQYWSVSPAIAGTAATVMLVCSSIGGWLAGYLSDRIGRVLTLKITILWFSVFSVLCAFTQTFDQLIIARALLGFGFGGEWAAGAVLMGELVRPQYRGRAVGAVQSGNAVGFAIAALLQALLFALVPPTMAWRWMFAAGGLPAILTFTLLTRAVEPPLAVKTRAQDPSGATPIWEIFKGPWKTTLLASIMMTGAQGGYYAMSTWLPRYLTTERHISIVNSTSYLMTLFVGNFVGFLAGAWLADVIGRKRLFLYFSLGAIVVVLVYLEAPLPNSMAWLLGLPLGFFSTGFFSGLGPFLSELFPTRLRGSGQGFCYNFGRGIGALFPAGVGLLSELTGLATAIAILSASAYALFLVTSQYFPETAGKELE